MFKIALLLTVLVLFACTSTVTSYTKNGVTLKYDPFLKSKEEIQMEANELCGNFDKQAHLLSESKRFSLDFVHANFECIE